MKIAFEALLMQPTSGKVSVTEVYSREMQRVAVCVYRTLSLMDTFNDLSVVRLIILAV